MKKIYLLVLSFVLMANFSLAQWTQTTGTTLTTTNAVGIGTNSPTVPLHVIGNGLFTGSLNISGNMQSLNISTQGISSTGDIAGTTAHFFSAGNSQDSTLPYVFSAAPPISSSNYLGSNPMMLITAGFGSDRAAKVLVRGYNNGQVGYGAGIVFDLAQSPTVPGAAICQATNGNGQQAADLEIITNMTSYGVGNHYRFTSSGNLLIGETSQTNTSYRLDVAGSVRANAITVNTTGADFVFASSYKLLPLPTLKEYITQNHHLPEIASAKEMQANGLNVGDNQIKLLQKVEELTLYLIAKDEQLNEEKELTNKQQQQIDAQQQVNIQQENRLNALEKEIEAMKQQMDKMAKQPSK